MILKQEILAALERSPDAPLSGQALAQQFGVSRSAVWKAVNALKREGYEISSATNRGYRLEKDSDRLSADRLAADLGETLPVRVFRSLDSTNNEAKRLLAGGMRCPFLVAADEQTGGRGRSGHAFYSPAGAGLYMSLAMAPGAALTEALRITAYAAVCTAQAIEMLTDRSCGIKWVNDLYLDGKKVCGILTEAITDFESGGVDAVVIGIGVNLHPAEVPAELREIVGFLDAPPVKNKLAAEITRRLLRFDARQTEFVAEYRRRSTVLGKKVQFESDGRTAEGVAAEIDDSGALLVQTADGRSAVLRSGTVRVIENGAE